MSKKIRRWIICQSGVIVAILATSILLHHWVAEGVFLMACASVMVAVGATL